MHYAKLKLGSQFTHFFYILKIAIILDKLADKYFPSVTKFSSFVFFFLEEKENKRN